MSNDKRNEISLVRLNQKQEKIVDQITTTFQSIEEVYQELVGFLSRKEKQSYQKRIDPLRDFLGSTDISIKSASEKLWSATELHLEIKARLEQEGKIQQAAQKIVHKLDQERKKRESLVKNKFIQWQNIVEGFLSVGIEGLGQEEESEIDIDSLRKMRVSLDSLYELAGHEKGFNESALEMTEALMRGADESTDKPGLLITTMRLCRKFGSEDSIIARAFGKIRDGLLNLSEERGKVGETSDFWSRMLEKDRALTSQKGVYGYRYRAEKPLQADNYQVGLMFYSMLSEVVEQYHEHVDQLETVVTQNEKIENIEQWNQGIALAGQKSDKRVYPEYVEGKTEFHVHQRPFVRIFKYIKEELYYADLPINLNFNRKLHGDRFQVFADLSQDDQLGSDIALSPGFLGSLICDERQGKNRFKLASEKDDQREPPLISVYMDGDLTDSNSETKVVEEEKTRKRKNWFLRAQGGRSLLSISMSRQGAVINDVEIFCSHTSIDGVEARNLSVDILNRAHRDGVFQKLDGKSLGQQPYKGGYERTALLHEYAEAKFFLEGDFPLGSPLHDLQESLKRSFDSIEKYAAFCNALRSDIVLRVPDQYVEALDLGLADVRRRFYDADNVAKFLQEQYEIDEDIGIELAKRIRPNLSSVWSSAAAAAMGSNTTVATCVKTHTERKTPDQLIHGEKQDPEARLQVAIGGIAGIKSLRHYWMEIYRAMTLNQPIFSDDLIAKEAVLASEQMSQLSSADIGMLKSDINDFFTFKMQSLKRRHEVKNHLEGLKLHLSASVDAGKQEQLWTKVSALIIQELAPLAKGNIKTLLPERRSQILQRMQEFYPEFDLMIDVEVSNLVEDLAKSVAEHGLSLIQIKDKKEKIFLRAQKKGLSDEAFSQFKLQLGDQEQSLQRKYDNFLFCQQIPQAGEQFERVLDQAISDIEGSMYRLGEDINRAKRARSLTAFLYKGASQIPGLQTLSRILFPHESLNVATEQTSNIGETKLEGDEFSLESFATATGETMNRVIGESGKEMTFTSYVDQKYFLKVLAAFLAENDELLAIMETIVEPNLRERIQERSRKLLQGVGLEGKALRDLDKCFISEIQRIKMEPRACQACLTQLINERDHEDLVNNPYFYKFLEQGNFEHVTQLKELRDADQRISVVRENKGRIAQCLEEVALSLNARMSYLADGDYLSKVLEHLGIIDQNDPAITSLADQMIAAIEELEPRRLATLKTELHEKVTSLGVYQAYQHAFARQLILHSPAILEHLQAVREGDPDPKKRLPKSVLSVLNGLYTMAIAPAVAVA